LPFDQKGKWPPSGVIASYEYHERLPLIAMLSTPTVALFARSAINFNSPDFLYIERLDHQYIQPTSILPCGFKIDTERNVQYSPG